MATHRSLPRSFRRGSENTQGEKSTHTSIVDDAVELIDEDFTSTLDVGYTNPAVVSTPRVRSGRPISKLKDPALGKSTEKNGESTTVKKTRNRSLSFTERDRRIVENIHAFQKAPLNHIAFSVGTVPQNIQQRVRDLVKRGYLSVDKSESIPLYAVTAKGLLNVGLSDEKPVKMLARSTYAHRNQINTTCIFFSLGGTQFFDLMHQHQSHLAARTEANNRQTEAYNLMLENQQAIISTKPLSERSEEEQLISKRRPRRMQEVVKPTAPVVVRESLMADPQVVFPEKMILRSISNWGGDDTCSMEWTEEYKGFLLDNSFPLRQEGDKRPVSHNEREAMVRAVDGFEWLYRHWNLPVAYGEPLFRKRHMPDGVIVQPNLVAGGAILPQSWWLEVETNRKSDRSEVVRVIEQAFDHPLVRGVIYLTHDRFISNEIKKAKTMVVERLALKLHKEKGMDFQQSALWAKEQVDANCRVIKLPSLYPDHPSQFWG